MSITVQQDKTVLIDLPVYNFRGQFNFDDNGNDLKTGTLTGSGSFAKVKEAQIIADFAVQRGSELRAFQLPALASIYAKIDAIHATLLAGPAAQETIYTMKAAEASAYAAAGYPTSGVIYPMLAAEATATGVTKRVAADLIIATRAAWYALLGTIEGIRRTATAAINLGTTAAEIEAIKIKALADLDAL